MISFVFMWIKAHSYIRLRYISHTVRGIAANTTHECDFVCVTDQVKEQTDWDIAGHKIRAFPLVFKFQRHQHNKLEVFRRDLNLCERAILTDLDNFYINNFDEMLEYWGVLGARSTFLRNRRPQPQLSWTHFHPPSCHHFWDRARRFNEKEINAFAPTGGGRGDQLFLWKVHGEFDRFDDLYPGMLDSWKWGWDPRAKILFVHGKPKPHQLSWDPYYPVEKLSQDLQKKCVPLERRKKVLK